MSDDILRIVLQKVENMEHKITSAKSLNGGFDKLMIEVSHDYLAVLNNLRQNRHVAWSTYKNQSPP